MRAYTDSVARALLTARKVPIVRSKILCCTVPYALEGLLRRELDRTGATLNAVNHGALVEFAFSLPEDAAREVVARLAESGNGRVVWGGEASPSRQTNHER